MAKRKSQSRVDELGVRDLVENMFAAKATYPEINAAVKEVTGQEIPDSSLSRTYIAWASAQRRLQEASTRTQSLVELILKNPTANLEDAGYQIIQQQVIKCLASADLSDVDTLEVANLFYKGLKLQSDIALQKSQATAFDRAAVYLDCLKEFTTYLTKTAPDALTALSETFDGFIDEVKKAHAAPAH